MSMNTNKDPMMYHEGNNASIGDMQMREFYWKRQALLEIEDEKFFGQLADVTTMPKHHGKTIRQYNYLPLLDDRNTNDQGIDMTGANTKVAVSIAILDNKNALKTVMGHGTTEALATEAAEDLAFRFFKILGVAKTDYDTTVAALVAAGWTISVSEGMPAYGNLYGSSKDVGFIGATFPQLTENSERVNRVGYTRRSIEGTMAQFGFFYEYTQDSLDFDSEDDLMMHIHRETLRGANTITEDMLQIDLLNSAGINLYGGSATSNATLDDTCILDYNLLFQVDRMLNDVKCPKNTTIITGSRMVDTRTIAAARYCYIGAELKGTLLKMTDVHGNPAFIPTHQYGDATTIAKGEIGSVGHIRFIEVPRMFRWGGVGAAATDADFYATDGKYDVFPALIVGSKSFTTIGFESGNAKASGSKFQILHKKPGIDTASNQSPYGKLGFYSIQWWYGFMAIRPEWIAVLKVTAPVSI